MSSVHNTVIVAHIKQELGEDGGGGGGVGAGMVDRCCPSPVVADLQDGDTTTTTIAEPMQYTQESGAEESGPETATPPKCLRLIQVQSSSSSSCRDGVNNNNTGSSPTPVHTNPSSPDRPDSYCSSTMPGDGPLLLHEGTNKDDDSPKRLCLVCGDIASGFHYGVASCEACKAFFKRTIQGNIEYTCPANNDCEINKRRRKACQACRFQKCLGMGMLKEGVRLDRVRGGRQKYRRNPDVQLSNSVVMMNRKPSLEDNTLLVALSNCEPDPLLANVDPSVPDSEFKLVSTLSDLVDRELVCTISWAKQIPGFTELSLDDQMRLLQSSWVEILTLSLAYRSLHKVGRLRFASDLVLDARLARQCQAEEMFTQTVNVVERLERLFVQREEYLLLKALLLVNSDVRVDDYGALRRLREKLLQALGDCVTAVRPHSPQHLGALLLCLPALRQVDGAVRRFWSNVKREGRVSMQKLLVEMLESQLA